MLTLYNQAEKWNVENKLETHWNVGLELRVVGSHIAQWLVHWRLKPVTWVRFPVYNFPVSFPHSLFSVWV